MLWIGWVQTVPQDILWAMHHLDIRTPLGILYMLHYPQHCKNPLDMLWVLKQGFHIGNLLDKWYIVFVLYCCYRNQIHKVWVVDLYLDKKIQQDIPGMLLHLIVLGCHYRSLLRKAENCFDHLDSKSHLDIRSSRIRFHSLQEICRDRSSNSRHKWTRKPSNHKDHWQE